MKNTQYSIENYHIDFSRNKVTVHGEVTILPPKAMAVLAVLIERQGEVIAFDDLLKEVWADTVVTVNTLHRCISQLRKTFADDSKLQRVIKTHAKQGYSLLIPADVITDEIAVKLTSKTKNRIIVSVIFVVLALLFLFSYQAITNDTKKYSHVNVLTSSDDIESYGSYSPDGRFIVFQRNIDACYSDLWAKDLVSQEEFKLTHRSGIYGQADWSPDGNHLVFSERNNCPHQEAVARHCWSVNTLNFTNAIAKPQKIVSILDCSSHYTNKPQWFLNGEISFLQEGVDEHISLLSYNPRTTEIKNIYTPTEQSIYSYDYSFSGNRFAVLSFSYTNEHNIEVLNNQGEILSSNIIELPKGVSIYQALESEFHPAAGYLITATSQGLFRLYVNGKMESIAITQRHSLHHPSFHPDGERIIATESIADTDILLVNIDDIETKTEEPLTLTPYQIARSNLNDDYATFQPSGNIIAFTSKRTGKRQLWVKNGERLFQLSDIEAGIQKKAISWSPSGKKIASLADNKVHIFTLNQEVDVINSPLVISAIMDWPTTTELLVKAIDEGKEGLYLFDVTTNHLTNLSEANVAWANQLSDTQLIYLDSNNQIWITGEEKIAITALFDQLERPVLALDNRHLFGINKQRQLWRYSLDTQAFDVISQLPLSARYVSDVSGSRLLLIHMNEFRKELIELN